MDAGEGTPEEIATAYRLLDVVNRRLGGHRLTARAMIPLLEDVTGRVEIVDVAGGSGEFARRMLAWAGGGGREPRVTVVDLNRIALAAARDGGRVDGARPDPVAVAGADALALPFADRSIDVVHCSCFFHHLSTVAARDLLSEMCRVSRRYVIVNDLVRSRIATASIWTLTRTLVRNRLVRADGPLSVLKSFVPDELVAIAHAVGLSDHPRFRWSIARGFPYRMVLVGARVDGSRARTAGS
jgi:ubiquinone/menaquinone biosynthesis C-methylase UbiE